MNRNYNSGRAAALRIAALALCVLTALCLCACANKPDGGKDAPQGTAVVPAEKDSIALTAEQTERIMRLASAFRQFGAYDNSKGATFAQMEYILFCLLTDGQAAESDDGFVTVSAKEADKLITGVFGDMKIMDVMRRAYDPEEEQTYYFRKGDYRVMLTDNSAYSYRLESVYETADSTGNILHEASVTVLRNGEAEIVLDLMLIPDGNSVYRVSSCAVNAYY